ncbi:MAG: hypothetical protein EAZ57_09750 [Cytophagales bacterium]|nr:MAG: hypothetical protein EAZ67_10260 [Cytophagales bacterium]TAF59819.1 MAG: hypothetical protein EAZ57_09750 [Cytophagales bacterium]
MDIPNITTKDSPFKAVTYFGLLFTAFLVAFAASAQDIAVGSWRTHLTYVKARSIAIAPDRVYCATAGGLCFYDKQEKSIEVFTKIDGLSDTNIERIAYHTESQNLIIAYANGNLDILSANNTIVNIRTILSEPFLASRKINHIAFLGELAYISTNFGISVLDMSRKLIKETYRNLGESGAELSIIASGVMGGSLYAATPEGLRYASMNSIKSDFNNWQTTASTRGKRIESLAVLGNRVYFSQIDNNNLYVLENPNLTPLAFNAEARITNLTASGNQKVIACTNRWVAVFDAVSQTFSRNEGSPIAAPREAALDASVLWIADQETGFLSNLEGSFKAYTPSGPFSSAASTAYYFADKVLVLAGSVDKFGRGQQNNDGFYVFEKNQWKNYNSSGQSGSIRIPKSVDLHQAAYVASENKIYLASFGTGLLIWNLQDDSFEVLDSTSSLSGGVRFSTNRISGVCLDSEGQLWVSCYGAKSGQSTYYKRGRDNNWQGMSFNSLSFGAAFPLELCADRNGNVWARLHQNLGGGGLLVIKNDLSKARFITEGTEDGDLVSANVNCLHLDREGNMFVGTEFGLNVFYSFSNALSSSTNAELVFFENRPLYRNERITAIATDGGNRRWIAANNSLALFSADFVQKLSDFNTKNSPLLAESMNGVVVQGRSGEVFVTTVQGIISYRGTATESGPNHSNQIKVFPNPVTPDFKGLISIEGLANNALFKITDINGRLVFQGLAAGGTATWNGLDYTGKRVTQGIYLIFSSNADGSDNTVSKIAFLD